MTARSFVAAAVCAVAMAAAAARPVAPGQHFPSPLLDVRAPSQAGWQLAVATDTVLAFVRRDPASARSHVATVALFAVPAGADHESFLALVRQRVEQESPPSRFRMRSSSVEPDGSEGRACVWHRAEAEDLQAVGTPGAPPPLLQMHGRYCRHPQRAGLAYAAAYSSRGAGTDAGVPEAARAFIEAITVPTAASAPRP